MPASASSHCAEPKESFAGRLIAWQQIHGRRELPWQGTRDPYRIWLSEIMLQQTQVGTVIPYFLRFVADFPDVHALAGAPLSKVLEHWSGLGYYSRARNLHRAAQQLIEEHGGRFPEVPEALQKLPGIGRSTAAAICAFAFGARAPILDGNVKRVVARHRGVEGVPAAPRVQRRLWDEAARLLPVGRSAGNIESYTQGLMDLGATVCVRTRPACKRCPVHSDCVALISGRTAEIPAPRQKRALPHRTTVLLIIEAEGKILLERRPPSGIWGGLWSLPEMIPPAAFSEGGGDRRQANGNRLRHPLAETATEVREETFVQLNTTCVQRFGWRIRQALPMPAIEHTFTHFRLTMIPFRLLVAEVPRARDANAALLAALPESAGQLWIAPAAAKTAALPAPIKSLLSSLAIASGYPRPRITAQDPIQ